jgi:pimeloyl-ACP methyl ester carboxylesterase
LYSDIKLVIKELWKDDDEPPIILVGHSMGGAIGIQTAFQNFIKNLVALIVIDVVEGKLTFTNNSLFERADSLFLTRLQIFTNLKAVQWTL